jgi:general secretion pathway protein C
VKHAPLAAAICLLGAACASGAYWGMQLFRPQPRAVAAAARPDPPPAIEAAAGLFGGAPAGPATTAFQLKGVIDDGPDGVALLAVDGKPALAVGVGQAVAPGVTVTEIHLRYVLLAESGAVKRLDLPDSGVKGLELVAAAPDSRPVAPARAPAAVAKSGGAMPRPVVNPHIVVAPGLTPEQTQQAQQMQQVEAMRARRPAGVGPAAFGAKPTS